MPRLTAGRFSCKLSDANGYFDSSGKQSVKSCGILLAGLAMLTSPVRIDSVMLGSYEGSFFSGYFCTDERWASPETPGRAVVLRIEPPMASRPSGIHR
ncbi:hypothetical protein [Hydrocarboniphaga sp.]|uniref:hypothetical protein n=1 Tax=Hydrocarboniphaga sp. TaxID=2033016 RepID=UPI002601E570|nr:hypothetical protein [Hydrocarboniphaga sp.]